MKIRIIRDALWSDIDISDPLIKDLIDTPLFQRLRRIKMTSFANFTYPSATASRFEHSISAMHLLKQEHFQNKDLHLVEATLEQELSIIIALLHHLSFYPFSYVTKPFFDVIFNRNHIKKLNNAVAVYIYSILKESARRERQELKLMNMPKNFVIDFIACGIGKFSEIPKIVSKKMPLEKKRRLKDFVNEKVFSIPSGINFIEAFCRDLHLSGIGRNFQPSLIAHGFHQESGDIDKIIIANIITAIHSLESAIDLIYNDEQNSMCSIFLQRILYSTWFIEKGAYHTDKSKYIKMLKPLKDFLSKINTLKSQIEKLDDSISSVSMDDCTKLLNILIEIDDCSLFDALKSVLINVGLRLSDNGVDSKEKAELLALEKMINMILYGGEYENNFVLKKLTKTDIIKPISPIDILSFKLAADKSSNNELQNLIAKDLVVNKDVKDLFFPICYYEPSVRLRHYLTNIEELESSLKTEGNSEALEIIQSVHHRITKKYQDKYLLIYDKKTIKARERGGKDNE